MDKTSTNNFNAGVVYHTTSAPLESLKKYGLCSPKDLYIKDVKEFENGTKKRYLGRVAVYLNKPENEVSNNDILNYLDTYRPPCTSKSCFFSFNKPKPNKINPITKQRNITFAIPIEILKKYAVSNPILSKELKFTTIQWNDLKNNLSKYEEQAYKDIPNSDGYYRNILHLAVNINTIPFKELIPVTDESIGNENMNNSTNTNNRRKQIEEKILSTMKIIEPGLTNYNRYEKMFKEMSDDQFDRFMNDLKDGKIKLTLLTPNLKVFIKQEDLLNAADSLGLELFERLRFKDKATGKYFLTPNKYLITKLPVRRTRQFLMHKLSIAENDKRIDALTGQVTSDDKASSISYPEAQLMYARGLNNCITEFMKVRGGDIHAFATFKQQLEETGSIRMNSLDDNTLPRSAVVLSAVLKSMYFDNNLV